MKVSIFSILSMMISILIIFGLPLLFFWFFRKKNGLFRAMAAGSMAFFVAQYVIRIPLINRVLVLDQFAFVFDNAWLYAFILAITAAFFELVFRVLVLRFFTQDIQKKHHILAVGFGHGLIEAILLVGLPYINNIIVSFLINDNRVSEIINDNTDPALVEQVVDTLVNTSSWVFLVGGLERVMMVGIHMAITILAFKGLKNASKRLRYWGFALLVHFVLDFSVVVLQLIDLPIVVVEAVIVGFAVGAWMIIKKFYHEDEKITIKPVTRVQDEINQS